MPYIKQSDRGHFDALVDQFDRLDLGHAVTMGQMNYHITSLLITWLGAEPHYYADYNGALGVLEAVKLEFYRRAVAPYEDTKREANGDVF